MKKKPGRKPKPKKDKLMFRPVGFIPREWDKIDKKAKNAGYSGGAGWVRQQIRLMLV